MRLEVDWPPSVNDYWRTFWAPARKGRCARIGHALTQAAKAYREHVLVRVLRQTKVVNGDCVFKGLVALRIHAHPPDRRRRDVDNLLKALLDSLEHARVFNDDFQVQEIYICRGVVIPKGRLVVRVEPFTTPLH